MSYNFWSFMHIFFVITIFVSLAQISFHIAQGGTKENLKNRKFLSIIQGVSSLIVFVAGFGLIAKGGFQLSSSLWIYVKMASWLLLGLYPLFLYKKIIPAQWALYGLLAIAAVSVYTVAFKPF